MSEKEKKIITYLLSFFFFFIMVHLFIVPNLENSVSSQFSYYSILRKNFFETKSKNLNLKSELTKWEEVPKELEVIKKDYLFSNSIDNIRITLKRISSHAGIPLSEIHYNYEDLSDEITKIQVNFNVKAPYATLRRFIGEIENEPRFIILKSINLLSTSSDIVNARISIFIYSRKEK